MQQLLKQLFNRYGILADDKMYEQLQEFYHMVIVWNEKFNLTAITDEKEFAVKHILDSCLVCKDLPQNAKVIDVGAGAGFPSIPLKILRPDLNIVMLDSLNKRIVFLNEVINKLKLSSITAVHARAEDYAIKERETFDASIARAVASMETLIEYCLPFVKQGGHFIAMKGASYQEELDKASYAIQLLGGEVEEVKIVKIAETDSLRANIIIKKISSTPAKYPRGKNLPRLKPLIKA